MEDCQGTGFSNPILPQQQGIHSRLHFIVRNLIKDLFAVVPHLHLEAIISQRLLVQFQLFNRQAAQEHRQEFICPRTCNKVMCRDLP